jgi:hypothetical protein
MRFCPGTSLNAFLLVAFTLSGRLQAEPASCSPEARFSPCFDADALWLPTHAEHFSSLRSARPLASEAATLLFGMGLALDPVVLVAPAPDVGGREIHVVRTTTTLTFGVGFGLGHGFGVLAELPFVPYQQGTGVEGVTSQQAPPLGSAAVRDPRFGVEWTAFGREPSEPVALAPRLELAPPLGEAALLAGAAGMTVIPGLAFEARADRFTFGADTSLRLRRAVTFGSVQKGSEAVLGAGASVRLLSAPLVRIGLEAWLRPGFLGPAPDADPDALDLPAEWLASSVLAWERTSEYSLALGAGGALPLSHGAAEADGWFAGVTAPAFRAVVALRFTPGGSE